MNARIALALLPLFASAPTFAATLYNYFGLMEAAPGAENPWGLQPGGTLFFLRVLVDPAAPDADCCNPGYAQFRPITAILDLYDSARGIVTWTGTPPLSFHDEAAYDTFGFSANVELYGVTLPVYISVRLPPTTFALDPEPGGPDAPPLFEAAYPIAFGAASNDLIRTFPDHEHGVIGSIDTDADGWDDGHDICLLVPNDSPPFQFQADTDGDLIGNACDGDFNNDCQTNFIDLSAMKDHFFVPGDLQTDLNSDGITNFTDLGMLKGLFFLPPGPSGLPNICDLPTGLSR